MTQDEDACIGNCSEKWIKGNQRIMQMFMEVQMQHQQALAQEMERRQQQEVLQQQQQQQQQQVE